MSNSAVVLQSAASLLGCEILGCKPIYQGRNSAVFCLTCADGTKYCAKQYCSNTPDGRSRLQVEFDALTWLADHELKQMPRPIAADAASNMALYEWIDGEPGAHIALTTDDIDAAADFLFALNSLRHAAGASEFPHAAEACFSFQEVLAVINRRLAILKMGTVTNYKNYNWLLFPFIEELEEMLARVVEGIPAAVLTECVAADQRVLSPSDFGFHNAIRRPDGEWVFVDFEYFGWDDPAKMIADFCLHPGMNLAEPLKKRFVSRLLPRLDTDGRLEKRLPVAYALFGIKWSLILLNEFVPEHLARRTFSGETRATDEVLAGQLEKAKAMLKRIWEE